MTEGPSVLAGARHLRRLGLSVFRIPYGSKIPDRPWKEFQSRFATDAELVDWFDGPSLNIGVITGAISDVVVIDADALDALRWCTRRLPYTPWQTKTVRGFHLFYRHPGVPVRNCARLETREGRLAIDVRGDGGYVIAPGSVHPSGVTYGEAGDWTAPRSDIPRFWPGWLQRPPRPGGSPLPTLRPAGDLVDRARRYLCSIPCPEIGAGSDRATLSAACRLLRGLALNAATAEQLLWEWCGNRVGWDREWVAQKVANAERYGSEPLGALR
jgi:bifunctional DNA primase/polymerase-like protein